MKPKLLFLLLVLIFASYLLLFISVSAQGGFSLDWWTVDGGGGSSNGSSYSLVGSIGQPDAVASSGGSYALFGGFWGGGLTATIELYLPLITR